LFGKTLCIRRCEYCLAKPCVSAAANIVWQTGVGY
jgi:hypothetical protein